MTLAGLALLVLGSLTTWRLARRGGPYRAGPWPGLTATGAQVLLGCALLLGGAQVLLGNPHTPLPDVPLLGALALAPLALAMRIVGAPGAAAAVCGAYLLPRTLVSLAITSVEPPPLLLIPALAFEICAWLRAGDLANLAGVWPRKRSAWRKRDRPEPRRVRPWRAALAGGMFGLVLAAVEPPFALLLGADPATWSGTPLVLASGWSALGCALVALGTRLRVSGRGRAP